MNAAELNRVKTMQLATSREGQPWACTVYFVVRGGNFYWLSFPERRHSRELAEDARAAVAIAVHQDVPVVGVQAEGAVDIVSDIAEAEAVLGLYVAKYGQGSEFIERLKQGRNRHQLYRLVPSGIMLFDERTPAGVPYGQIHLTD
jgi:nitroimidazol reductase NimA-like FMN-containing flavoprotein (pyridoxamine 5'-phosphate oxidase superfamily)